MGCAIRRAMVVGVLILSVGCTTQFVPSGDATTDAVDPDADVTEGDVSDTTGDDPVGGDCETDEDCDNGIYCDGEETCGPEGTCIGGGAIDCSDDDPCTEDTCDEEAGGCKNDPLDADGDGYPALGSDEGDYCGGTDCNDHDDTVHPDAEELCNLIDEDCDEEILDAEGIDDDGDGVPDAECGGNDCADEDEMTHGVYEPPPGIEEEARDAMEEICDGYDNDCNGDSDDAPWMECVFGEVVTCSTHCGLEGSAICDETCLIPEGDECNEPDEVCNLASDDCDEVWDEGVLGDSSATDIEVGILDGDAWHPRACFDGTDYNVVWMETSSDGTSTEGTYYYAKMSADGAVVYSPMALMTVSGLAAVPPNAAVACGTRRIGVVVYEPDMTIANHHVILYSITSSGWVYGYDMNQNSNLPVDGVDVTYNSLNDEFVVVWARPSANDLVMQRSPQEGITAALSNQVISSTSASSPRGPRIDAAPNGSLGIGWLDFRDDAATPHVYFRLLGSGPVVPGGGLQISDSDTATTVDVASTRTGHQFRVVWDEYVSGSDGEVYTAGVDMLVVPYVTDGPTMISLDDGSMSSRPSIDLWDTHEELLVSWSDFMAGSGMSVVRLAYDGTMIDGYYDPVSPTGSPYHPEVVGGPGTHPFAAFWDDGRNAGTTSFDLFMDLMGCY